MIYTLGSRGLSWRHPKVPGRWNLPGAAEHRRPFIWVGWMSSGRTVRALGAGVFPGVSARRERLRRAECNKAPSMYQMEGACGPRRSGSASCRFPRRHAPPASARYPREPPVSRLFPRPGVALGWCPFPTVKAFLPAAGSVAQEPAVIHFELFRCPHVAHRMRMVIRMSHSLSTGLSTNHPQVTWHSSGNTSAAGLDCNGLVFPGGGLLQSQESKA